MKSKSVEVTDAVIDVGGEAVPVQAAVSTTQERYPYRGATRTVFQMVVSLAAMWGVVVQAAGLPGWSWVAISLAVAAGITRVMALPDVEVFLRKFLPFLSAAPKPDSVD